MEPVILFLQKTEKERKFILFSIILQFTNMKKTTKSKLLRLYSSFAS